MKRTWMLLTSLLLILGGGMISAPAASAAGYGCSGSLIDTYNVSTSGGTKYGEIQLYYSTANGGTNCAVTVDTYFGSSVKKPIRIHIIRCEASAPPGAYCAASGGSVQDWDSYYTYAGPVSVTSMSGRCVRLSGGVTNPNNTTVAANRDTGAVHCG
ncbi:hypothetical protein [Streptomyces sp. NP-1717]|uniref:hypothetical protein n=1 Tax=Streptomyces sp. NP-1717 TaxID=2704470 RepID=UPI001F5C5D80|nr:hypothetical protein [Streptomyces sp. NP-1717]MCI3226289.1 hypothetical protein [Streptomyces sp. NP-1717]